MDKTDKQLLLIAMATLAALLAVGCGVKETSYAATEVSAGHRPAAAASSPINNKGGVLEHIQSFEGTLPDNWQAVNGNLELSGRHYKHKKSSLRWQWEKDSRLLADDVTNMDTAGRTEHGGMIAWIYNEKPVDGKLTVNLGTKEQIAAKNPRYTFDFYMNFKGWRALWIDFKMDAVNKAFQGKETGDIEQLEIWAPDREEQGELYLDLVEFVNNLHWCRAQDYQIPIQRANSNDGLGGTWERSYYYIKQLPRTDVSPLTDKRLTDIRIIEKKV